jgi:hypothetical protein
MTEHCYRLFFFSLSFSQTIYPPLLYCLVVPIMHGTFSHRKVNAWRTLCQKSPRLVDDESTYKTSLMFAHSSLFTKILKSSSFLLTFIFLAIQMFQFTFIFYDCIIINIVYEFIYYSLFYTKSKLLIYNI